MGNDLPLNPIKMGVAAGWDSLLPAMTERVLFPQPQALLVLSGTGRCAQRC
jgi:hypothetical protein